MRLGEIAPEPNRGSCTWALAVVLMGALCSSCSHHPSDADMIREFESRSDVFQAVASAVTNDTSSREPWNDFTLRIWKTDFWSRGLSETRAESYRALLQRCCSDCSLITNARGSRVFFQLSVNGLGLKGSYKGIAYSPEPPFPLSDSFDFPNNRSLDDCGHHFRPIRGNWYLYYQSCR